MHQAIVTRANASRNTRLCKIVVLSAHARFCSPITNYPTHIALKSKTDNEFKFSLQIISQHQGKEFIDLMRVGWMLYRILLEINGAMSFTICILSGFCISIL